MNGACHQLLAGTAFPGDQNRRAARCRLDDQVEDLLHPRTASDNPGELLIGGLQILAQRRVLSPQPPTFDRVADHDEHLVVLERLGDVVEGAPLHRADRALDRGEGGHHQNGQLLIELLELVEGGDAVHTWHHHVDNGTIERRVLGQFEPFGGGGGKAHLVALASEQRIEDLPHDLLVVDDQDGTVTAHGHDPATGWPRRGRCARPGLKEIQE